MRGQNDVWEHSVVPHSLGRSVAVYGRDATGSESYITQVEVFVEMYYN